MQKWIRHISPYELPAPPGTFGCCALVGPATVRTNTWEDWLWKVELWAMKPSRSSMSLGCGMPNWPSCKPMLEYVVPALGRGMPWLAFCQQCLSPLGS